MASPVLNPALTNSGAAPSAAVPGVAPQQPLSFLKKLGKLGLEGVTKVLPVLTRTAQVAEPAVDLLFPLEGPLFNAVVNAVCLAEVAGANAAGTQSTGPLKFEAVMSAVGPQLLDLANQHGLVSDSADGAAKQYIQAIYGLLNGPAKAKPVATPTS